MGATANNRMVELLIKGDALGVGTGKLVDDDGRKSRYRHRYSTLAQQLKAVKTKNMLSMIKDAQRSMRDLLLMKAKTQDILLTKIFMSASLRLCQRW